MAKILSQVDTIRRGSVGGITYTANQWHQIIARQRTAPVDPATNNQTIIRTVVSQLSAAWENQTDEVRQAWDDYAATCVYQGPLGTYTIPGRQMFIACLSIPGYCQSRGLHPFGAVFTPPAIPGFYNPGPVYVSDPTTPGIHIALSVLNETGEDGVALIQRSFAFPASRNRFKGPFLSHTAVAVDIPDGAATLVELPVPTPDLIYFTIIRLVTELPPYRISSQHYLRHVGVEIAV